MRTVTTTYLLLHAMIIGVAVFLVVSNRRQNAAARDLAGVVEDLRSELGREKSLAADRDFALSTLVDSLYTVRRAVDSPPVDSPDEAESYEDRDNARQEELLSQLTLLATRPETEREEFLTPEEWSTLNEKWGLIDIDARRRSVSFHKGVDVDAVLADELWNPTGRELSLEERISVAISLRRLRYFSRTSPLEGLHSIVIPSVEKMRTQGEFVEYVGPPPPPPQGATISHAEPADAEGGMRIYYFPEERFEQLYRRQRIEREQAFRSKVEVYETVNGALNVSAR